MYFNFGTFEFETLSGVVEVSDETDTRGGGGITGRGGGSSRFPPDMATGETLGGGGALVVGPAGGGGCRERGGARGGLDMAAGRRFALRDLAGPKMRASAVLLGSRRSTAGAFLTFPTFSSADFRLKLSTMTLYIQ